MTMRFDGEQSAGAIVEQDSRQIILHLGGIEPESIVDGPGFRYVVFVQGCHLACPGCHNQKLQAFIGGYTRALGEIMDALDQNPLVGGLTLSGGEPFTQAPACAVLAGYAKNQGLHVMSYSGYTFEALLAANRPDWNLLLASLDILVDGPYIQAHRNLELLWRGSSNQRLINVPASLKAGKAIDIINIS